MSHVIPQLKGTINFAPSLLWPRQEQDFDAVAVPAVVPDVGPSGVNSCFQCDAVGASDNLVGTWKELNSVRSIFWAFMWSLHL